MERFGLSECLSQLRDDLGVVAEQGEGKAIKFRIDEVGLELQLVAAAEAKAAGGVKWWIVSADAGVKSTDTITQKLSLKLSVTDAKGNTLRPIAGETD